MSERSDPVSADVQAQVQAPTEIEGQPPDLVNLPPGCSFRDRCRWAVDKCATDTPPLMPAGDGHWAACWRADEIEGLVGGQLAEELSQNGAAEPEPAAPPDNEPGENT